MRDHGNCGRHISGVAYIPIPPVANYQGHIFHPSSVLRNRVRFRRHRDGFHVPSSEYFLHPPFHSTEDRLLKGPNRPRRLIEEEGRSGQKRQNLLRGSQSRMARCARFAVARVATVRCPSTMIIARLSRVEICFQQRLGTGHAPDAVLANLFEPQMHSCDPCQRQIGFIQMFAMRRNRARRAASSCPGPYAAARSAATSSSRRTK